MPSVLTQVDKDDSLETFMDEQKEQRLKAAGWVTGDYGDFLELTPEERAIVEQRAEKQRLEREVIEAAKEYGRAARATEDHMKTADESQSSSAEGWRLLRDLESTWENFLLGSVYALLDFESKQK